MDERDSGFWKLTRRGLWVFTTMSIVGGIMIVAGILVVGIVCPEQGLNPGQTWAIMALIFSGLSMSMIGGANLWGSEWPEPRKKKTQNSPG